MRNWLVAVGTKHAGPVSSVVLQRSVNLLKVSKEAFIRPDDGSDDWQQIKTVDWLVGEPFEHEVRYCLECGCRAYLPITARELPIICPGCGIKGQFVNFLDPSVEDAIGAPEEPWGKYDLLALAMGALFLLVALVGTFALIFSPSLAIFLGFVLLASGSGLFAITLQHRGEAARYRAHLLNLETALQSRTQSLSDVTKQLKALKADLQGIKDDLVLQTEVELSALRAETKEQLDIARDQQHAVHRMAERFLTETQKWWTTKLTSQNYELTKERITKAIEFCRKQGYPVSNEQTREILAKLRADFEIVLKKEADKAEQDRIREQVLEEKRIEREVKREIERTQKEAARRLEIERRIESALADALQRSGAVHSAEVEQLQRQLEAAKQNLAEAQLAAQKTISQAQLTKAGNVYVISNMGSFGQDGYKVGLTRRLDPMERVRELGDASVPFPFDVHLMIRSDDAPALERQLHLALHMYRMNRVNFRKEFFRVSLDTIRKMVEKYHGTIEYEYPLNDESEYAESLRITDEELAKRGSQLDQLPDENFDDDLDGLDEIPAAHLEIDSNPTEA